MKRATLQSEKWSDDLVVEAEKDDGEGGVTLDGRRGGWGGYNK